MENEIIGIIPARNNSSRVPNKNIEILNGHPMIAYSIIAALNSQKFNKVIVASDSDKICSIAKYYGSTDIIKRQSEDATSTSPDISWLKNLFNLGKIDSQYFAILRPTSPLRTENLIRNCVDSFLTSNFDSLRTIKKVGDHPGKMWRLGSQNQIIPYLPQQLNTPATHALQYQSLEELYVQTSVFEIAKTSVIPNTNSREGSSILGFITSGVDSHSVDSLEDMEYLKYICKEKPNLLPLIQVKPYSI